MTTSTPRDDFLINELDRTDDRIIVLEAWPLTRQCICYVNGHKPVERADSTISTVFDFVSDNSEDWPREIAAYVTHLESTGRLDWSDPIPGGGFIVKFKSD